MVTVQSFPLCENAELQPSTKQTTPIRTTENELGLSGVLIVSHRLLVRDYWILYPSKCGLGKILVDAALLLEFLDEVLLKCLCTIEKLCHFAECGKQCLGRLRTILSFQNLVGSFFPTRI